MISRSIPLIILCLLVIPSVGQSQGPRAGVTISESSPWGRADRLRDEGRRVADRSRGGRGVLIGMAIGAAAGLALGYLTCDEARLELPCPPVIAVLGAGGLVIGGLIGYSVATDPALSQATSGPPT